MTDNSKKYKNTTMKKLSFLLCIMASISFQMSNTIFKKLDSVGPYTIAAGRFLVMLMVVVPISPLK